MKCYSITSARFFESRLAVFTNFSEVLGKKKSPLLSMHEVEILVFFFGKFATMKFHFPQRREMKMSRITSGLITLINILNNMTTKKMGRQKYMSLKIVLFLNINSQKMKDIT